MRILVVGGNGFLGKEIFRELDHIGHDVIGMCRSPKSNGDKNWVSADIGRPDSYRSFISDWQPEVVIQGAWVTAQKTYRQSSENLNYASDTLQFAKDCLQMGTNHFIGLGSSAEYGIQTVPCNATDTTPAPVDPYGQKKLETLLELQELTVATGARLTWGRVFQPYGIGQDSERLIPWAVSRMMAEKDIELQNPFMKLDWISSRDIANAISWCIKNVTPEVIDIGTTIGTSVHAVLIEVARILEVNPEFIRVIDASDSQTPEQSLVVSTESPLFQSGWRPDDSLESGLSWVLGK